MKNRDWWWQDEFPRSEPIQAHGGIKAQAKKGKFGSSWWAQRWIKVLEGFNIASRLQRGRSYARRGQVLSVDVKRGAVSAQVQGSRPKPYAVEIQVRELTAAEWQQVAERLASQAVYAAKLLSGDMPQDIETAFRATGVSLLPASSADIRTKCSCPDWSNPCKHIAAVYYLIGEAFDADPFLMFRLRGIEREEFSALLGDAGADDTIEPPPPPAEPLPADPREFWAAKPLPTDLETGVTLDRPTAALLQRLGNPQFWRGETTLREALEPVYEAAARRARELL